MRAKMFFKKAIKCLLPYGVVRLRKRKAEHLAAERKAKRRAEQKRIAEQEARQRAEQEAKRIAEQEAYERSLDEARKCFGSLNPDKTFYVSRRPSPGAGLFSNYHWVLANVMYAVSKGYIPVVDMENYKTYYNEDEPINGTMNAWEYYFEQPSSYTLYEVYQSKNVILGNMRYMRDYVAWTSFLDTDEQVACYSALVAKYLRFNDAALSAIEEAKQKYFDGKQNILGVSYRGTDYVKMHLPEHSIIASIDDYIEKTRQFLSEWNMEYVYLATEEVEAVEAFKRAFGNKLIVMERMRIKNYAPEMGVVVNVGYGRQHDNYQKGLEYIIDMALLSKCDALIGSKVNGTSAAIELNGGKYKHKYIYDLGVNP